jgi:alkanesulfonate monooxygenase SsuD/methylene tetrahydromethanopterin reductase-like flavin-dependent oxidoreductase (luciferase family)
VEQTAEIADGWIPFFFNPEQADEILAPVRAGGRDIDVSPAVLVCVDDDVSRARDMARPWLAIYLGGMGAKGKNFYVDTAERMGHGESARRVQELFMAGDRAGAGAAISDEIIDACSICCRAPDLDDRLAAFERAGADTLLAMPFGDRPRIVEALAAAARGAAA